MTLNVADKPTLDEIRANIGKFKDGAGNIYEPVLWRNSPNWKMLNQTRVKDYNDYGTGYPTDHIVLDTINKRVYAQGRAASGDYQYVVYDYDLNYISTHVLSAYLYSEVIYGGYIYMILGSGSSTVIEKRQLSDWNLEWSTPSSYTIYHIDYNEFNDTLYFVDGDQKFRMVDIATGTVTYTTSLNATANMLDFDSQGNVIIVKYGGADKEIQSWVPDLTSVNWSFSGFNGSDSLQSYSFLIGKNDHVYIETNDRFYKIAPDGNYAGEVDLMYTAFTGNIIDQFGRIIFYAGNVNPTCGVYDENFNELYRNRLRLSPFSTSNGIRSMAIDETEGIYFVVEGQAEYVFSLVEPFEIKGLRKVVNS